MKEPLIDNFGRVHNYLRISLTDKCNLRCSYCMPSEGIKFKPHHQLMQHNEIVEIAKTFVELGVNKIRLTGGEPLVRSDASDIIQSLSKLPVELNITTNGILIHEYFNLLNASGIKEINISLDTLQQEKFEKITRRKSFEQIIQNIDSAIKKGFKVKINNVAMKGVNEDELLDFVRWTLHLPIDIRFIEYMPFNGNKWEYDKVLSFDEILKVVQKEFSFQKLENPVNSTSRNFKIEGAKGQFGIISSVTNPFCKGCNRIRLTADGKIKNCLFSESESDILGSFRRGENIEMKIRKVLLQKHKSRGGLKEFELKGAKKDYERNRSMIAIGG